MSPLRHRLRLRGGAPAFSTNSAKTRLSELSPGSTFVVSRVLMGGEIGKRLADMGFTDGATGLLVRGAFMRGPIQVRIRGYDLLLRRGEAKLIEVGPEAGDGKSA